jgi:hypothetical protein
MGSSGHQKGSIQWFLAQGPSQTEQQDPNTRPFKQPRLKSTSTQTCKPHLALRYAHHVLSLLSQFKKHLPCCADQPHKPSNLFETKQNAVLIRPLHQPAGPPTTVSSCWQDSWAGTALHPSTPGTRRSSSSSPAYGPKQHQALLGSVQVVQSGP